MSVKFQEVKILTVLTVVMIVIVVTAVKVDTVSTVVIVVQILTLLTEVHLGFICTKSYLHVSITEEIFLRSENSKRKVQNS